MISIGIDVSKRKNTVAIINVMGEILQTPFDIEHNQSGLNELFAINVQFLRKIFQGMKIHLPYAIFNSSKMVFNSTPF